MVSLPLLAGHANTSPRGILAISASSSQWLNKAPYKQWIQEHEYSMFNRSATVWTIPTGNPITINHMTINSGKTSSLTMQPWLHQVYNYCTGFLKVWKSYPAWLTPAYWQCEIILVSWALKIHYKTMRCHTWHSEDTKMKLVDCRNWANRPSKLLQAPYNHDAQYDLRDMDRSERQ